MPSRERDAIEYLRRPKRENTLARCSSSSSSSSFCRRGSGVPSVTLRPGGRGGGLLRSQYPAYDLTPRSSPSRVRGEQASRLPGFHMQMQPNVAKPFATSTVRMCRIVRLCAFYECCLRFLSVRVYVCTCACTSFVCEILYDGYPPTLPVRGNFSGERTLDDEDRHLSSRNLREEIEREKRASLGKDTSSLILSFSSDDYILSGPIRSGGSRFC